MHTFNRHLIISDDVFEYICMPQQDTYVCKWLYNSGQSLHLNCLTFDLIRWDWSHQKKQVYRFKPKIWLPRPWWTTTINIISRKTIICLCRSFYHILQIVKSLLYPLSQVLDMCFSYLLSRVVARMRWVRSTSTTQAISSWFQIC